MVFAMEQCAMKKINLMEFYNQIQFAYNTTCNNFNNIILFDSYTQQSKRLRKEDIMMSKNVQCDINAVGDVFGPLFVCKRSFGLILALLFCCYPCTITDGKR